MKQITLTLILAIATFYSGYAQHQTISIESRTQAADLVVEGRLLEKVSFWDSTHSKILTANTLEVFKVFKGDLPKTKLILLTEGGVVGNDFQIVTHSFQVPELGVGIFFLKSQNSPFEIEGYYANCEGSFIEFMFEHGKFTGFDVGISFTNLKRDIYEKIESGAGRAFRQLKQNPIEQYVDNWLDNSLNVKSLADTIIEFSFENIVVNGTTEVEFDIYAKSNQLGIKFAASNVYIEYSEDAFGSNIVANDKIHASKRTVIDNAVYSMTLTDHTAQVVKFNVTSGSLVSSLYPLSTSPEEFLHVIVEVENIYELATISFDGFSMANESVFYDSSTNSYFGFDKIIVSEPAFPFLLPHIEMIGPNPIPAGTGDILTITGTGFGDHDPLTCTDCKVRFPNGDAGGGWVYAYGKEIISWTNTEIQLKVPSATEDYNKPAMSGKIRTESPEGVSNEVDIHIPYSVFNIRTSLNNFGSIYRIAMSRQTPNGVLFQYDEDVSAELKNTFETSVGIWCDETSVAWNISANDIDITTESGTDNINSVVMRPSSAFPDNALAAMVLSGHYTSCGSSPDAAFYFKDIDIIINEDSWNPFEDNWENKWQNAFLHELGHAHCLNHSKKPSNVQGDQYLMIADQGAFSNIFMQITEDDGTGANTMFNASAALLSIGGTCANIAPIITGNCGEIVNAIDDANLINTSLKIYPNPITGNKIGLSFFASSDSKLTATINDVLGREILKSQEFMCIEGQNNLELNAEAMKEKGLYFVTLTDGLQSITIKIIKL